VTPSTLGRQHTKQEAVVDEQKTGPEGSQEDQDTEGHKFNVGLGPVTPDGKDGVAVSTDEDTEGHRFNIGLGPVTPDEDSDDTEGHRFNIGLGPVTPDDKGGDTEGDKA
jgi:hypothetical protein